jgi:hypothetical protein
VLPEGLYKLIHFIGCQPPTFRLAALCLNPYAIRCRPHYRRNRILLRRIVTLSFCSCPFSQVGTWSRFHLFTSASYQQPCINLEESEWPWSSQVGAWHDVICCAIRNENWNTWKDILLKIRSNERVYKPTLLQNPDRKEHNYENWYSWDIMIAGMGMKIDDLR